MRHIFHSEERGIDGNGVTVDDKRLHEDLEGGELEHIVVEVVDIESECSSVAARLPVDECSIGGIHAIDISASAWVDDVSLVVLVVLRAEVERQGVMVLNEGNIASVHIIEYFIVETLLDEVYIGGEVVGKVFDEYVSASISNPNAIEGEALREVDEDGIGCCGEGDTEADAWSACELIEAIAGVVPFGAFS